MRCIVATPKMAASGLPIIRYLCQSELIVEDILVRAQIQKDKDVSELYLAHRNLIDVHDLKRFLYLKSLWLNGNKLRRIACLNSNFRLCELYLHDNALTEISGALQHLTCLRVLLLHNNQLTKLDTVACELQKMLNLQTLSLFDNPIALEPEYRFFIIHTIPSLSLLDRQEVSHQERTAACRVFDHKYNKLQLKVAFGRCLKGQQHYLSLCGRAKTVPCAGRRDYANNYLKNSPIHEDLEEAVYNRRLQKSLTIFSSFDWSKIPRCMQRRTADDVFGQPTIVTRIYR